MIHKYPQQTAWFTLISGFLIFCLLCVGTIWAMQWFAFESAISLQVTAHVSRGTMGIASPDDVGDRAVRVESTVSIGETISTDELTQGHLTFRDPLNNDTVLATVQLMPSSQVRLQTASRPRFGLGDNPFIIRMSDAQGGFDINISPQLEREIRLEIEGAERAVRLDKGGYYIINITEQNLTITVREGQAILINRANQTKLVEATQTGIIRVNDNIGIANTLMFDLIPNSLFKGGEDPNAPLPTQWGCSSPPPDLDGEPRGEYAREFFQDRYVMHLSRDGEGYSRAGCEQVLRGLDVSSYDSLRIRANMFLVSHSLSGCGTAGSECVIMLRMRYYNELDIANNRETQSEWIQGFYIHYDPNSGARIRCESCVQEHIHVNEQTWYTFETGDFVLDLPSDQANLRPVEIIGVEFYSSGHSYEAYISEFALIGQDLPDN